jgi:hypothetical protein
MKQSVYADVRAAKAEMAEDVEDAAREADSWFPSEYEDPYWPATNEPSREYMPDFFDDEDTGDLPYDPRDYYPEEEWPTWREDNFGEFGP